MKPLFCENNPFRRPQWRADRVLQMIEHRPNPLRPGRHDDHYVRAYRRFLISCLIAGDDEAQRNAVIRELPDVYRAHVLHYCPDQEWRDILQARLLTGESSDDIAQRYATDSAMIDYYEKTFFNVRDRLGASVWIYKVALRPPPRIAGNNNSFLEKDQRGYLLRLCGYYGGPLVLDAMLNGGMQAAVAPQPKEAAMWLDDVLGRVVTLRSVAAAHGVEVDKKTVMRLLKLASPRKRPRKEFQVDANTSADLNQRIVTFLKEIESATGKPLFPA